MTAYVRQNASLKVEKETIKKGSDEKDRAPDPDIQAIMTVLRRRTHSFEHGEPGLLILPETNLRGADLTEANLSGANLIQAQLEQTMTGDENTTLPPYLKPPAHWGVKTGEQGEEN